MRSKEAMWQGISCGLAFGVSFAHLIRWLPWHKELHRYHWGWNVSLMILTVVIAAFAFRKIDKEKS